MFARSLSRSITVTPLALSARFASGFTRRLTRTTGRGLNVHRSNRAKNGLYHGRDIRSGHSISHSHTRSKRKFYPNVFNKRVWSFVMDDWVRFKMTAAAMKAIDDIGGIDNYLLGLDERSVQDSIRTTRMRNIIAALSYHKGTLTPKQIKRFGYDKNPPQPLETIKWKKEDSNQMKKELDQKPSN